MSANSIYGYNAIIREYTGYPSLLPLVFDGDHGWAPGDYYVLTDQPMMLVLNRRRLNAWKEKSSTPAAIIGAPFVHYRKLRQIEKDKAADGTVAFPSHSTDLVDAVFDIDEYCKLLKNLPLEYHPITICLHEDDFVRKKDLIYKKYEFKIVTAGPKNVPGFEFVQKFYEILRSHKFATSNQVGSYSFYAVEMGIPFFILGEPAVIENSGEKFVPNVPSKYSLLDFQIGVFATAMFQGPTQVISEEQKKFVEDELGIHYCLSGIELKQLLLESYQGVIKECQEFLKTGQGTVEDNILTCRKLVNYFQYSGEKDKQLKYLLKSLVYAPPNADFCCQLGYYFLNNKQYEQGAFWYDLANKLDKPIDNWLKYISNIQLCVCYENLGKHELAYKHNEIAGDARPGDSLVLHNKQYLERMYGCGHTLGG